MASVGSLSSSTSNSIRGYGGLASGLDRDELIKGMTLGTTSKLNQQEQKKQKIEWMQEAVRAISDKMISFHGKYTETLTSPTNLFSSLLWGRNKITTSGDNSKYVSISGTASGADAMTIMGIKQAQNASLSSTGKPASTMTSESIDFSDVQTLKNQTLEFSYAGKDYKVLLNEGDYSTVDNAVSSIQNILNKTDVGEGKKLGDVIKVTRDGDAFKIEANEKIVGDKPTVLKGGTALEYMGIENKEVNFSDGTQGPVSSDTSKIDLEKTWAERVKGQTLTFSYNGTEAKIEIANDANTLEEVQKSLQKSLDAKFGKDRVSVDIKNKDDSGNAITPKLTFRTTIPGDGATKETDDSSILKVTGGNYETLSALGLRAGLSNRTNFDEKVDLSAFGPAEEKEIPVKDKDGNDTGETVKEYWYKFKLNGEDIQVRGDENGFATKKDLINAINNSNANVTVTYQEAADKFTFTSKVNGASGVIDFSKNSVDANNKLSEVFGLNRDKMNDSVRGQDAIVAVKYAGSDQEVELRRDSNTFTVDGLTIALKGEFGYKKNDAGELERDHSVDAVEINASVDVDKLMDTIKSFVADYNAIVDLVNGELTTKHDRDYDPLTSDQKAELSETEISKWETKAKEGLLYGDSDLRSLSMDLRVVVSGGLLVEFEKIGINLSSSYSDNGKLSIDESKLRAALETDPEKVQNLFTSKEGGIGADGKPTSNGLATNLKSVMDKYVKTVGSMETKGILIRKAGSKSAAQSLTQNTYYDQLTALDKLINQLKTRLKTEQDRYISQFSTLETMIANMNSQSSYLSSMGGY